MPEEAQPRNITRADLVLTEGFGLEVGGRMKTIFPTHQAAEKKARALKAEFPMLQIKVYDAAEKTRTLVELPPDIHDGQEHKRSMQGPDTDAQDQPPPFFHIRLATHGRSIQLGQTQTSSGVRARSVHPRTADIATLAKQSVYTAAKNGLLRRFRLRSMSYGGQVRSSQ